VSVGVGYDTRDDEIFPRHGAYNQMGVEYLQGAPTNAGVEYGEAEVQVSGFRSLGPVVFAGRFTADFQFGNVPFYDLLQYGVFGQFEAIGGEAGVRGVPVGRYLGEIKMYANAEVRTMFLKFSLFKQRFGLGADALLDAGRSWLDYSFKSSLDGSGLGLKYGVGGGIYALWGQAALFRIDVAYSPDAAAENPHFPVGLYVADGTNF
jgi:outer membrane protein assembly factor BamA